MVRKRTKTKKKSARSRSAGRSATQPISPVSMTVAQMAKALTAVSAGPVKATQIRADLKAGAPSNPDGTLNLVHYAAWMHQQIRNGQTRS